MTTSVDMVMTGGIVAALVRHGSWCGETHIQKATYIAKIVEEVPFQYDFVLYKHGPYSFDLSKSLSHMRSRRIVSLIPRERYGPSYELNVALWSALNRVTGNAFNQHGEKIDKVCSFLSQKKVDELERIATAVFVARNFPKLSRQKQVAKLIQLKPHIAPNLAAAAFAEANGFMGQT